MVQGLISKSMAQSTITSTTAGAVIITPISLTQESPLNFGVMAVLATTPGACILSTIGIRTASGGVNLSAAGVSATNAAFSVVGLESATYSISLPSTITVTETLSGTETMTIDALSVRAASNAADGFTGTLNGAGVDNFTIGGTLNVQAAQVSGIYSGSFNVTVAYN